MFSDYVQKPARCLLLTIALGFYSTNAIPEESSAIFGVLKNVGGPFEYSVLQKSQLEDNGAQGEGEKKSIEPRLINEWISDYSNSDVDIRSLSKNENFQKILRQYEEGGPAASIVGTLVQDMRLARSRCPGSFEIITPKYSEIRFHHHDDAKSGYFDVYSSKNMECASGEFYLLRRWVIIVDRRLDGSEISNGELKWMIKATGTDIKLASYYEHIMIADPSQSNDQLKKEILKHLIPINHPDMKHYYDRSANSCIELVLKDKPDGNDGEYVSNHPDDVMFCARGCRDGDVDATM